MGFLWAETLTSDRQRGIDGTLRGLPIAPLAAWGAKLGFTILASMAFAALLCLLELTTRWLELQAAGWPKLAALESSGWRFGAVTLPLVGVFATILGRPLIALVAGAATALGCIELATARPNDAIRLVLGTWDAQVWSAVAFVAVVFLQAAIYVHRLHGREPVAIAARSALVALAVLLPIAVPAARTPIVVYAVRPRRRRNDDRWGLGRAGTVPTWRSRRGAAYGSAVRPKRSRACTSSMCTPAHGSARASARATPTLHDPSARELDPWDARGRLAVWSPEVLEIYDPRTERVVWRTDAGPEATDGWRRELGYEPWCELERRGATLEVRAAGGPGAMGAARVPALDYTVSPDPATVYYVEDEQVHAHDLLTDRQRTLGRLRGNPRRPRLSPCGRYLCVQSRVELVVFETATGSVLFETTEPVAMRAWSRRPGSVFQLLGSLTGLVDATGALAPLPPGDYFELVEHGDEGWLGIDRDRRRIDLLDAAGSVVATLCGGRS